MFTAILEAIAALPKLFAYVEKFSAWLSDQIILLNKKKSLQEAQKAIDQAQQKKDTSDLENLFKGGK